MKLIGKILTWLLVAILLIVVALYILLQTRWGASWITGWVNTHSDYHIAFDRLEHRFASPSHLVLRNVTFGRNGQPATLVAKRVDIGLSSRQLTDPLHADTILLQNGTLNLSPRTASLPLQADSLRLENMAFNSPDTGWDLSAQRVNGGVAPWLPKAGQVLGDKATFQLSAGSLTLNDIPASNVLVQGNIDGKQIALTTFGADVAKGSMTGNARRDADGGWHVDRLRLNDIRLQSDKTLAAFFYPLTTLASLKLEQVDVTDARLQGPDWAVTDLDMSLRDLTLRGDSWQSEDGTLSMNASEFILGSVHLFDPIVNADLSPQGVTLRQFTSRWEGGMVRTSGNWLRDGDRLVLNDVALAGLEYTLPDNWKALWMQPLPAWLESLTVMRFNASRNLLIDIDPTFPFQITSLDGYGNNLQLVKGRQWGIWGGSATFNGALATFNRLDVRNPSITFNANASAITISELSAFAGKGLLEATAVVSQLPDRQTKVSLNGRGVPVNVLQQWGWPPVPLEGDSNLHLTASGAISATELLKPSVNARLEITDSKGQKVVQTMRNGALTTAAPATPPVPTPAP
ncbi:AsmA family protein [Siccibacter turicensis]|uniref:AsmA family protein n=1 Tax=Siccibacter turicensis TaxID=357233 RepID=UPI001020975E|nr:AsmA family protein [Siccibacter turicensis]